ncbi:hypothetical protein [Streptomyces heilongjiangensis]|uniref:DinB/UmuC family translesion DNA polymerase n=1 Tax=Streptomyces heilongjiangensis TaxID=945052 RepID=UPI00232AD653|nr:hypothetical protein [Streptomyces heilongjiangensis]MDC2952408.1 hypothetical protein [Streptomyces heilongjiangensis]
MLLALAVELGARLRAAGQIAEAVSVTVSYADQSATTPAGSWPRRVTTRSFWAGGPARRTRRSGSSELGCGASPCVLTGCGRRTGPRGSSCWTPKTTSSC